MKKLHKNIAPGNARNALAVQVAWFPFMKSTNPESRPLVDVLDGIQNGEWQAQVDRLRVIRADKGGGAYNRAKVRLPSFFISGTASSPRALLTHSGLIQVDLDDLDDRLSRIRDEIVADPQVAAVFTSPSGGGLKIVFRLEPLSSPLDRDEHKRAFAAVTAHFEKCYKVTPDQQCKNLNRHCLVSYDPDLFLNPTAIAFNWRNHVFAVGEREKKNSSPKPPILQDSHPTVLSSCGTSVLPNCHTTPQVRAVGPAAAVTEALAALKFQHGIEESQPRLWEQYQQLVERRHEARGGKRNATIIEAVPYLYRALSTPTVRLYMEWFYRMNAHVFKDPLEMHMRQVDAMLRNVERTYMAEISITERHFWGALPERGRASFRICRDLAFYSDPKAPPPPEFYLSGETLAMRHGLLRNDGRPQDEAGARDLRLLVQFDIISVTAPGRARSAGVPGVPTRYRWMLPLR